MRYTPSHTLTHHTLTHSVTFSLTHSLFSHTHTHTLSPLPSRRNQMMPVCSQLTKQNSIKSKEKREKMLKGDISTGFSSGYTHDTVFTDLSPSPLHSASITL